MLYASMLFYGILVELLAALIYTCMYICPHTDENTSRTEKLYFVLSAVNEAVRVGNNRTSKQSIPVYPYSRHTYDPAPGPFYSKVGTKNNVLPQ